MKEFYHYIFGSLYTFRLGTAKELGLREDLSGDTDVYTKVVRIRTDVDDFNEPRRDVTIMEGILRHEIFHAVMYETGLLDYFDNETLALWFEVMFPKIENLLSNVGTEFNSALASLRKKEDT